jgi:hypothetical protein
MVNSFAVGVRIFVIATTCTSLSQHSFAQSAKPNPQELMIGDSYTASIQLHPQAPDFAPTQETSGRLVKLTDDWIVLSSTRVEARVRGVPWVSELPYVGALFRTESQNNVKLTTWIPRGTAKIIDRQRMKQPPDDEPKLEGECLIFHFDGNKDSIASGEILEVANGQIKISALQRNRNNDGKTTVKRVEKQVNLDTVQYISQRTPVDNAKEGKQVQAARTERRR